MRYVPSIVSIVDVNLQIASSIQVGCSKPPQHGLSIFPDQQRAQQQYAVTPPYKKHNIHCMITINSRNYNVRRSYPMQTSFDDLQAYDM